MSARRKAWWLGILAVTLSAAAGCSSRPKGDAGGDGDTGWYQAWGQGLTESDCRTCHVSSTCVGATVATNGMACAHHNLTQAPPAGKGLQCTTCHTVSPTTGVQLIRDCTICHGSQSHEANHATTAVPYQDCASCHAANVYTEHINVRGRTCSICHQSTDPNVQATLAAGKAGQVVYCAQCHVVFGHHAAQHDKAPISTSGQGFIALHETAAKPTYCFACHQSTAAGVQSAIQRGMAGTLLACADCHPSGIPGATGTPPSASAGGNQTVQVGQTASFSGAGSQPGSSPIASYAWAFGDGGTASGVSATHVYATAGTFQVTLTVTDASGLTATASATVTVQPATTSSAPLAVANPPQTVVVNTTVNFSAQGSTAAAGRYLVDYQWSFGDGSDAGGGFRATHTYSRTGTYPVTLTVKDSKGATATATSSVTVVSSLGNRLPVAVATVPSTATVNQVVTFDGTRSSDPDGRIVLYQWDFGDRNLSYGGGDPQYVSGATVTHAYGYAGKFLATLTVYDDKGARATASATVTVTAANQPPVAVIQGSSTGAVGQSLSFSAEGSKDPDGTIVSYEWRFGDGDGATGRNVQHAYRSPGTYAVKLTVKDNLGATATATSSVTVK